ncbi:phage tail tape measure protein, partial [Candidatus Pacearchaeota archaeon]|nr:phage tail tape measure protein [Candidatus Pacearchaeota archaeon]
MAREKIHIDLVLNTKGFRPLGRINGQLGEFEKSLDASNARVLAFGASAGAILAVKKAFVVTVKSAIEVEKSLQDINVILGATSQNLRKFGSDLFEIASKTGQAFQVAATAATELARQGLGTEETLKRTRDALILARLAGMDAAEAVNALTAAINTFNKAGLDSTAIINKLANVDAAFAVSSDDLAKALGRVGASAQGAGVNFDELLAIVTTVQQKTARGGAVIGNSFKTIFTRIQRPRVIKELENLGIAIRGVEGEVLPAMKVLQNLAKQFDNLSQSQRAQVTELIGGVFQVNILKAAMNDLSKETGIYNRALGVSIGSSDQALRRNEELNKTLSAQFQRTVNTFKEGAAELGELTLGPTLEKLFGFVDDLSKFSETDMGKVGGAIAKSIFEGIGKFMSGPGLLVIGLVLFKTFSQLGKFAADAFKTLTGLNKNLQTQMNLQRQVFDVLSENPDLLKKIKDGTMTVEDAHEQIYKQIQKNTSALDEQLLVSNQLAQSLMGGGVGFSADFGATSGKKGRKFGSSGYIPSFAADRGERLGMMAGGYSRSQIKNPKTRQEAIHDGRGGVFNATVNGHESVFSTRNGRGKKATFVVPPKNSEAYDKYMSALSGGFVPSFMASALLKKGKHFNMRGDSGSFTGKGEDKVFGKLGGKPGTTLVLKDGSVLASDKPLHGMAAMDAGIDPRKIKGGGFHNVRKGQLTFRGSDMDDFSGGFIPNFNLSEIEKQAKYLEKLRAWKTDKTAFGGMPTLSQNKEENELGKQAGKVFGRTLWTTPSLGGKTGILAKAEEAHKKFRHNYEKSLSRDRTGQDKAVDIEGDKKYEYIKGERQAVAGTKIYDAKQRFGLLGLYGTKETDTGYAEAGIGDISEYSGLKSAYKRIGFKNLQYRSLTDSLEDGKQTGDFSRNIRKHFAPATENLANESSKKWLKDDAISVSIGKSGSSLFAKGAEGEIFETVINALSGKGTPFGAHVDARSFEKAISGDRNRTWDFEEVGAP